MTSILFHHHGKVSCASENCWNISKKQKILCTFLIKQKRRKLPSAYLFSTRNKPWNLIEDWLITIREWPLLYKQLFNFQGDNTWLSKGERKSNEVERNDQGNFLLFFIDPAPTRGILHLVGTYTKSKGAQRLFFGRNSAPPHASNMLLAFVFSVALSLIEHKVQEAEDEVRSVK